MDIIIAAEKSSIAQLLSAHTRCPVDPEDIEIAENPEETGSFYIGWHLDHFVMSPSGEIAAETLELLD